MSSYQLQYYILSYVYFILCFSNNPCIRIHLTLFYKQNIIYYIYNRFMFLCWSYVAPTEVKLHMSKDRAFCRPRSTLLNCLKKNVPTDKKLLLIYCTCIHFINIQCIIS